MSRLGKKRSAGGWPEHLEWHVTDVGSAERKAGGVPPPPPSPSDVAFLQFTSGSTSDPKGVMITHGSLAHNLSVIVDELGAGEETVVCSWLPQYHDMGLIGSNLGALYCGGCGYYMSPLTFLQRPMVWIEAVSRDRATHLQSPNFAFKLTARKFDKAAYAEGGKGMGPSLDLSSVRHVINGAEPVTESSVDAFASAFGPYGLDREVIYPTYGLAEHTVFVSSGGRLRLTVSKRDLEVEGRVTVLPDGEGDAAGTTRLLGCGVPPSRSGVDVRIVDAETSEELPEDEVGEIWVRSPSKAAGYLDRPELNASDFRARIIGGKNGDDDDDDDPSAGYLRTGDLGFLHELELFVCGRIKDLIITGGRNYYPQDLEVTAESCTDKLRPGCLAAFAVEGGSGDGEDVALVAELREAPPKKDTERVGRTIADSLRSAINREHSLGVAHIVLLRPRTVPKTTSGKISRSRCRKAYLAGTLEEIYRRSYSGAGERDAPNGDGSTAKRADAGDDGDGAGRSDPTSTGPVDPSKIRGLDRSQIRERLVSDICRVGNLSPDSVDAAAPMATIMDSLSLSQFKGMLEQDYAIRPLSEDYLFRDGTTVEKLVEVVKLGSAPDDGEGSVPAAAPSHAAGSGGGGIAQALGCPPGVVCCVVM